MEKLVPFILYIDPYAIFFAAPCFYFYLSHLADPDNSPGKFASALFVPPLLATLATIPLMIADPGILRQMLELSDARVYERIPVTFRLVDRLWGPWLAACFGAFFVRLAVRLHSGKIEKTGQRTFFAAFGLSVLCWYAIYLIATLFGLGIGSLAIFVGMLIFFVPIFFFLQNPDYLGLSAGRAKTGKYASPKTGSLDVESTMRKIGELMDSEKPYLDEELTLQSLAGMTRLSPQQLSELLNGRLNKNFRDWLNEYRIREALRLIAEDPERQVLDVAFESGFRSKSTFNAAFLRVTGETPREWKTKCLAGKKP
jgi:AraC-like DNA-binding protein